MLCSEGRTPSQLHSLQQIRTQHDMLPQHLAHKNELYREYVITSARNNKIPWWSEKIETCRRGFKCFKWKLYRCICWLIVEVILRNAWCNDENQGRPLAWPPNTVTEDWRLETVNTVLRRLNLWSCVSSAKVHNAKSDHQLLWMWCGIMCRKTGQGAPYNAVGLKCTTSLGKMEAPNRNLSKGNLKITNF